MKPELRMQIEAMAKTLKTKFSKFQTRVIAQRLYRGGWSPSGAGKQEMARRRRQIERGQLTKSNGLGVVSGPRLLLDDLDTLENR